nr:hypothetical protein [uncultured Albidiferax sp.]
MKAFFARLREPSTWAGIAAIATLAGVPVNTGTLGLVQQAVVAVAGMVAVLTPEKAAQ